MRVLHVVEATIAGVRRHVHTLACGTDRSRFQVAVACPPQREQAFGDDQFVADLQSAGVTVLPLAMRRAIHPPSDAQALVRLLRMIRDGHYDIVHTHSSKAGFLGRLAARLAGQAATVYSPHGLYVLGLHSPAKRSFYIALERFAGQLSDRIIAVSHSEYQAMLHLRLAPPERIVCIENGIIPPRLPPNYNRAAMRQALGQQADAILIGSVARLSSQKNPLLFVESATRLLHHLPDARFVWAGGGELAEQAGSHAARLGVAHAIRFLGHRNDPEQVIAALDMLWLTSNYEGLPCVLLEALALQTPIIATDVIGSRDALRGTNGLLVPPADPDALAGAALMLARDPARRVALARAGYAWFLEHGTAQRMLQAVEELYENLVAARHRSLRPGSAARRLS